MKIGGLQKLTTLDYPDKLACIVFTAGCNMRCGFCHNPNLVLEKLIKKSTQISVDEVMSFLEERKGLLDAVVISGGEPTIQKGLYDFVAIVKKKGFMVKLDTNGTNPQIVKRLIDDKLIDYVAMDIKASEKKYKGLTKLKTTFNNILKTRDILMSSDINFEFRTTLIKGFHDKEELKRILEICKDCPRYAMGTFRNEVVLDPNFRKYSGFSPSEMKEYVEIAQHYVQKVVYY